MSTEFPESEAVQVGGPLFDLNVIRRLIPEITALAVVGGVIGVLFRTDDRNNPATIHTLTVSGIETGEDLAKLRAGLEKAKADFQRQGYVEPAGITATLDGVPVTIRVPKS